MLHVQNTDGDAAPAVAAPAVAPSATSLDDYSDDSITALYFVLESFNDMENFIKRLEESWRVLMHGGVLFLSFPKNDVKDEVVRSLLLRSKFCSVERLERFGSFDVHVRLRLRMRVKNLGIFEKSVKNSIMLVKCVYKSVFLGISPNFARI